MATYFESERHEPAGILPAAFGCLFGLLGIFFIGIVFVPLAALCGVIGFVRGISSGSATAIGLSLLAGVLCFFGFLTSPSLWLVLGVSGLAALLSSHPVPTTTQTSSSPTPPVYYHQAAPAFDLALCDGVISRLGRFDNVADKYNSRMDAVKDRYRTITNKMNDYYLKEQALAGNSRAAVARGQLSVTINQGIIASEQYHMQVQNAEDQLKNDLRPLMHDASASLRECAAVSTSGPLQWQIACGNLRKAIGDATQKEKSLAVGFAALETFYTREHQSQAALVSQSEKLE